MIQYPEYSITRQEPVSYTHLDVYKRQRDTSGVLLFAKDEETKRAYQEHWDALVRRRGYLAVVEGRPPREEDTIRTLLRENAAHKVYSVRSGGKEAVTHYRTIQAGREYTLLEVDIDTGRKNQIRAHLSELGCPCLLYTSALPHRTRPTDPVPAG